MSDKPVYVLKGNERPKLNIIFRGASDQECGSLRENDEGVLEFFGEAHASAQVFFEYLAERHSKCIAELRDELAGIKESVAYRGSLLGRTEARLTAAEQRIASLHHVGMELMGVIDEYRAMPCDSLKVRMFNTADRYRLRLTAKCQTCKDKGVVYNDFNEVEGRFSPEPCPDCAKPAEPGAHNEQ